MGANAKIIVATEHYRRPNVVLVPADKPDSVLLHEVHHSYATFYWWLFNLKPEYRQHNFGIKNVMVLEYAGYLSPDDPVGQGISNIADATERIPPELRRVELERALAQLQSMYDKAVAEADANAHAKQQHSTHNPVPPTT